MLKKFMAGVLAVAMVVAMWVIPTSAAGFADSCVIDIDYTQQSVNDSKGALTFARDVGAFTFVEDLSAYGSNVGGIQVSETSLKYTGNVTLGNQFAYELYGVFGTGELMSGSNWPCEVNSDGSVGAWYSPLGGSVYPQTAANDLTKALHILIVGSVDTYSIYINGELAASKSLEIPASSEFTGGNIDIRGNALVAKYVMCARVYNSAPTAEDAMALYKDTAQIVDKAEAPLILKSKPEKFSYVIGEELDTTGLAVATKADGVLTDVDLAQCTITGFDSTAAGTSVVTVSYETEDTIYTNKFTVKITAPVSLSSIVLAAKPSKLIYEAGEALDTTGLAITAKYSDGSTALISEGLTVTGYEATTAGVQRLTVAYGEFEQTTSFSVRVKAAPEVRQIVLASKPAKLYYANGEALDVSGLTVKAKYTDGSTAIIEAADLTVTGYDATAAGVQRLTVAYGEFAQTTSFSVRVAEAEFSDQIIFNVDFRDETYVEQVRNITPSLNGTTFLGYVDANGGKVADLSSPTHLSYEIPTEVYTAMQDSYTMEIYVNITDGNNANLGFIAGDTGWLAPNGVTFWVRSIANGGMLFGKGTEISVGEMASPDKYLEGGQKGQWNHLVYVHDGDTGSYYVNGVLAGTQTVTTTQHDTTAGFHIGAYAGDGNFAALGQYSFVKVYGAAATADQVAALYAAR